MRFLVVFDENKTHTSRNQRQAWRVVIGRHFCEFKYSDKAEPPKRKNIIQSTSIIRKTDLRTGGVGDRSNSKEPGVNNTRTGTDTSSEKPDHHNFLKTTITQPRTFQLFKEPIFRRLFGFRATKKRAIIKPGYCRTIQHSIDISQVRWLCH